MTSVKPSLPAMTAIAAVLAFATPAMAQDVPPTAVEVAPESTPPADPAPEAAPATSETATDPLGPDATSEAGNVAPAATETTAVRTTRAVTPARRVIRTSRVSTASRVAITPVAAPTAVGPAPVDPLPAPTEAIAAPAVVGAPLPAAPAQPEQMAADDILPLAGAAGLGLLALLGAGAVSRRRKRREEDYVAFDDDREFERPMAAFVEPFREPTLNRAPVVPVAAAAAVASKPIDAPTTTLPNGFDLSRFGPHVQAAYRGPTDDNPSLSLKNRLRRASAMDQMARNADPVAKPAAPTVRSASTGTVTSMMRPASQSNGSFMLGGGTLRPSLRPVTQH